MVSFSNSNLDMAESRKRASADSYSPPSKSAKYKHELRVTPDMVEAPGMHYDTIMFMPGCTNGDVLRNVTMIGTLIVRETELRSLDLSSAHTVNIINIGYNPRLVEIKLPALCTGSVYTLVKHNAILTALDLSHLALVGNLIVEDNPMLRVVNLKALLVARNDVIISQNHALVELILSKFMIAQTSIEIKGNASLSCITLPELSTVNGFLYFRKNASLVSIVLPKLDSVSSYFGLIGNPCLAAIEAPKFVRAQCGIAIEKNAVLVNLDGFSNLHTVKESLCIMDNPKLYSLADLAKLEQIEGGLLIRNNASLSDVKLVNLVEMGEFILINNPVLETLNGLVELETISECIRITGNEKLSDINRLMEIESHRGIVTIEGNPCLRMPF